MRKHLTMAVLAVLASGCATVGSVKALEKRVANLEKKMAKVEAMVEENKTYADQLKGRIDQLAKEYDLIYEKVFPADGRPNKPK
ncbi:MAG: hypothetical protein ACP5QG_03990 [candidate division WOR-3 bacterium]